MSGSSETNRDPKGRSKGGRGKGKRWEGAARSVPSEGARRTMIDIIGMTNNELIATHHLVLSQLAARKIQLDAAPAGKAAGPVTESARPPAQKVPIGTNEKVARVSEWDKPLWDGCEFATILRGKNATWRNSDEGRVAFATFSRAVAAHTRLVRSDMGSDRALEIVGHLVRSGLSLYLRAIGSTPGDARPGQFLPFGAKQNLFDRIASTDVTTLKDQANFDSFVLQTGSLNSVQDGDGNNEDPINTGPAPGSGPPGDPPQEGQGGSVIPDGGGHPQGSGKEPCDGSTTDTGGDYDREGNKRKRT